MKITLSKEDLDLIGKALISYRWSVEDKESQNYEFHQCAFLADRLGCNHNGAELIFKSSK